MHIAHTQRVPPVLHSTNIFHLLVTRSLACSHRIIDVYVLHIPGPHDAIMLSPINNTKEFCKHEKVINHCPFSFAFEHCKTRYILYILALKALSNGRAQTNTTEKGSWMKSMHLGAVCAKSNFQFAQCA